MGKRLDGRGIFIAFEGIDLSGKTTQFELFVERLRGFGLDIFVTKEPGSPHSEICKKTRKILMAKENTQIVSRCELALFFADRAQNIMEPGLVSEKLQHGFVAATDRQWASTFAFQFFGRAMMQDFDFMKKMNDFFSYGVYPDMNILLDLPIEVAMSRARNEKDMTRFDKEKPDFHQRVKNGYLQLTRRFPDKWVVFDGEKPIETLAEEIFQKVCIEWLNKFNFIKK